MLRNTTDCNESVVIGILARVAHTLNREPQ